MSINVPLIFAISTFPERLIHIKSCKICMKNALWILIGYIKEMGDVNFGNLGMSTHQKDYFNKYYLI